MKRRRDSPRYVVTPHHHESGSKWHTRLLWKPYKPLAKRVVREADVVHSVSPYEAELIRRDFHVDPIVVPNGVSEDVFSHRWNPPAGKIILTYAGRVERYKHVDLILKCASILQGKLKDIPVSVRIIGRGSDLKRISRIARRLEVKTEHFDFLPRREYLKLLSNSTVFINLSSYEAYSIVTAEALALGIPSIVAEPWGQTFKGIRGAYIVDRSRLPEAAEIIAGIARNPTPGGKQNLEACSTGGVILPWSKAAELIAEKIYRAPIHHA